jgi:hypothetical protein
MTETTIKSRHIYDVTGRGFLYETLGFRAEPTALQMSQLMTHYAAKYGEGTRLVKRAAVPAMQS